MKRNDQTIVRLLALLLFGFCSRSTWADEAPGLKIGARAPAFTLLDQNGNSVSLSKLLEKGKVAIVFYRSADW